MESRFVLVPTTILAFQHYRSFKERLKDFPVNVAYVNRFRTTKQKSETLEDFKERKSRYYHWNASIGKAVR